MAKELPALDVRQLHYFVILADHGSISAAAAALQIAQPSLSENLSRLERKLGVDLVVRSGRGIILTEAGQLLASRGREIVEATARAVDEIRHSGELARGPVCIGLPPSLGMLLSVPLAETMQAEYPDVRLHITEGMSGNIAEWIEEERVDLGYVYEVRESTALLFQPLLIEKLYLITAPDNLPESVQNPDSEMPTIRGIDLESLPLALPAASHGARKVIERFARAANISLNVVVEIDSLPHIVGMVKRASAYCVLPHAAVINEVAEGSLRLVEIVEPSMSRTAYLLRKRSHPITRASDAVQRSITLIVSEMIERFKVDATVLEPDMRVPAAEESVPS